ncbi:MAG: ABC transporter permease subunit [Anaerolineae bacterium]|jgi:ABC-2 type transport system permease protein|nr:ABC transporter permease subunit [Anaerolineae bacterium]
MQKIKTIIGKEWAEVFKNKMVISVIIFMPLLFTAMMLGFLYISMDIGGMGTADMAESLGELPEQFASMCAEENSAADCMLTYMMNQFLIMYIFVPLIIPINIAAYSIVGEKTNHSLEPLLGTPITTLELLVGKMLSAVIPAVVATWLGFLIFAVGAVIISGGFSLVVTLLDVGWLVAIFLLGPLLSLFSVCICLMISSRVRDPRVAEQVSSIVILPVMLLLFGQIFGWLVFSSNLALLMSALIAVVDVVVVYFCVQLFERENILTRWK